MDLLSYLPTTWAPYALLLGAVCSIVTAAYPAPKSGFLARLWPLLNVLALNVGHARNVETTKG